MQAVAINNKTGLGLATPLRIVGKRDYFISLKIPYSVKRGEQVSLLVTVFNYFDEEMRVSFKILMDSFLSNRHFTYNTENSLELVSAFFFSFTAVPRNVVPQKRTSATMSKGIGLPTVNQNSQCFTLIKRKSYNQYLYL